MNWINNINIEEERITKNNIWIHNLCINIIWIITGILTLSAVGTLVLQRIGLPYLPELFFIPLILLYRKKIKSNVVIGKKMNIFFLVILIAEIFSIIIGLVNTSFDAYGILSCIRPLLYITLLANYFSKDESEQIPLMSVFYLCLGGQIGELLGKFLDPAYTSINSIDHINWLCMSFMIFIPTIKSKNKLLWFAIIVGLINAILSFYRRIMVFYILTIVILIIFRLFTIKSIKKMIYILFLVAISYFLIKNFNSILSNILSLLKVDNSLFEFRFISKFGALFNGEVTMSDQVRYNSYLKIIDNFNKSIIPNGPIGKSVDINSYFGLYTDTPIAFFIDVFGSYLAVLIIGIVFLRGIHSFFNSLIFSEKLNQTYVLCGLMFPLLLISLFDDGAFIVHLNYAWVTAYCVSGWFFSKIKRKAGEMNE